MNSPTPPTDLPILSREEEEMIEKEAAAFGGHAFQQGYITAATLYLRRSKAREAELVGLLREAREYFMDDAEHRTSARAFSMGGRITAALPSPPVATTN